MTCNNLGLYSNKKKLDSKTLDIFSNRKHISLYFTVIEFQELATSV